MAIKLPGKPQFTSDGIPYIWNSGDVTTGLSLVKTLNDSDINPSFYSVDSTNDEDFGAQVAISGGAIHVLQDDYGRAINNGSTLGIAINEFLNGETSQASFSHVRMKKETGGELGSFTNTSRETISSGYGYTVVTSGIQPQYGVKYKGKVWLYNRMLRRKELFETPNAQYLESVDADIGANHVAVTHSKAQNAPPYKSIPYVPQAEDKLMLFNLKGEKLWEVGDTEANAAGITTSDSSWAYRVRIGCNMIVTSSHYYENGSWGIVTAWDLTGNFLWKVTGKDLYDAGNISDTTPSFGSSIAIGSGRVFVGASTNGQGKPIILDLKGNFVKECALSLSSLSPWEHGYESRRVAAGFGRLIYSGYKSNSAVVYVYDLDGNEIWSQEKERIGDSAGSSVVAWGKSIDIMPGRVVLGAGGANPISTKAPKVFIYDTAAVYTPWDAEEMARGYK